MEGKQDEAEGSGVSCIKYLGRRPRFLAVFQQANRPLVQLNCAVNRPNGQLRRGVVVGLGGSLTVLKDAAWIHQKTSNPPPSAFANSSNPVSQLFTI